MTVRCGSVFRAAAAAIALVAGCILAAAPGRSQDVSSVACPSGYSPAGAACISDGGRTSIEQFRPVQAIRYVLGSKRVVGYFVDADGECRLTLMIAEEIDPMMSEPLPAARLVMSLRPAQSASLKSPESETMVVTCQGEGDTVEVAVRRRNVTAAGRTAVDQSIVGTP